MIKHGPRGLGRLYIEARIAELVVEIRWRANDEYRDSLSFRRHTTLFFESMIVLELNNYCSRGSDRYSGYFYGTAYLFLLLSGYEPNATSLAV